MVITGSIVRKQRDSYIAGTLYTIDSDELTAQRLGYIAMSLNEWTTTVEPTITAGSKIEMGGSLYTFSADEDMDVAGAWAGLSANSLVYCYINATTLIPYMASNVAVWDDAKQGYYHPTSPTHRCFATIYKDGASLYKRKNILTRIQALYLKDYAYEQDAYAYSTAGTSVFWFRSTNNVNGSTVKTTKYFHVKKPINVYIKTTRVSGDTVPVSYNPHFLYVAAGNAWRDYVDYSYSTSFYQVEKYFSMNPGKYKWVVRHQVNVGLNEGVRSHTIYVSGMYGGSSISKSACIDT